MDRNLIRFFWDCGDGQIIEFAMIRARLNRREKEVLTLLLDECYTQEEAAEKLDVSVRNLQKIWYSASEKMLAIPWVLAYAKELKLNKK